MATARVPPPARNGEPGTAVRVKVKTFGVDLGKVRGSGRKALEER